MVQQKTSNKSNSAPREDKSKVGKKEIENPKTYGKEPPMEDPESPEHPDEGYEVKADESSDQPSKPTLH